MTDKTIVYILLILINTVAEKTVEAEEKAATLEEIDVTASTTPRRLINTEKYILEQEQTQNDQFIQTENINRKTVFTIQMHLILIQAYPDQVAGEVAVEAVMAVMVVTTAISEK